jgi:ferrochelatase
LKPYTVEEVARLVEEEKKKSIAVMAPAFSLTVLRLWKK